MRPVLLRIVALLAVLAGVNYVAWRWLASVNWEAWWIAVPLVIAETYSLVDTFFFALTMWRIRIRQGPVAPAAGTVDVFITTYDEPVDLVMATAEAAKRIRYPPRPGSSTTAPGRTCRRRRSAGASATSRARRTGTANPATPRPAT